MGKAKKKTEAIEAMPEFDPEASFRFQSKGGIQPKGFEHLNIDEKSPVTIVVKGVPTGIRNDEWGKSFRIRPTSVEIIEKAKSKTMKDALNAATSKRKV